MAVGTFAAVCDVLNKVSRSDSGYSTAERVDAVRTLFADVANTNTGVLRGTTPRQRLAALLHLLIPGMDATPRRLDLTAIAVRDMFHDALTSELLPRPSQGWPPAEYARATVDDLHVWPLGAAQASVNRYIENSDGGDRRGVRIADVSEYAAAACPYGVPADAVAPTDRIKDTINRAGALSILDVQRLAYELKVAHPFATQKRVLFDFLTARKPRPTAADVPWNAEWRWFARIILRRMYANVREKRTLDALHPMAWAFSDLQHDIDSIADAFVSDVQFPFEARLGRHCRVMRCNALSYIPLVASTLNPQFISRFGSTPRMAAHVVGNAGGEPTFLLGHAFMKDWRTVDSVAAEAAGDRRMAWLGEDESVSQGDAAVKLLTTKAEHMIQIRFHAVVLKAAFPTREALAAVLAPGEGFSYVIMLYNRVHGVYEHLQPHRMWTLLQRDLAVPRGTQIHILPRGFMKRMIKTGKNADMLPPSVDRLKRIVATANAALAANEQNNVALAERAIGNAAIFDATPEAKGFLIEEKYDGERMQLHLSIQGDSTPIRKFFTRGGYDRTEWYDRVIGRVLEATRGKGVERIIVDGEMVVYDTARETYSPWGQNRRTARRENTGPLDTRQKGLIMLHEGVSDVAEEEPVTQMDDPRFIDDDPDGGMEEPRFGEERQTTASLDPNAYTFIPDAQLCFIVFDILHLNGQDLVSLPLYKRREILESIFPDADDPAWKGSIELSRGRYGHSAADIAADLEGVVKRQGEGLVVKDPFTPYRGGQSTYWQKVKAHSDEVDMAIVGFGFQVANDLASTGDPHISSFTVAVRDAKNPTHLLTVCEVPFFTVPLKSSDEAKEEYLQHGTAVPVDDILGALAQNRPDNQGFVKVAEMDGYFTLYAKRMSSRSTVVLKWSSAMDLIVPDGESTDPLVYYDASFTNIQVVAHPFLVAHSIAVYGDYRVNEGYERKSRFTAPLTIRFPRGTLRRAQAKQPSECDSTAKLEDLKRAAESNPAAVLAADLRRVHRVLPTGLRNDAGQEVVPGDPKRVPKRDLSIKTLQFANETDLVAAADDALVTAMKNISLRWPANPTIARDYAGENVSPPTSPLPSPRSPPSSRESSRASSPARGRSLSPVQFIAVPPARPNVVQQLFASPVSTPPRESSPRESSPPRENPQPQPPNRYMVLMRRLDTATAQMQQMLRRAEKAVERGRARGEEGEGERVEWALIE